MSSCAEARFHLQQRGLSRLDGDRDGVPCESQGPRCWCCATRRWCRRRCTPGGATCCRRSPPPYSTSRRQPPFSQLTSVSGVATATAAAGM
ncbi:excalibur calcium-binding domain-containing protein [Teichococcus vastitatis]|uniref:excalibur calcium-binding domain-containing protein n=1 Tax=Teichococcus vastitatis TaxID=2307076 RepID=UPI00346341B2